MLTWDDLNQFMSRKLLVGDIIEATKEIVYPNEGLVIPIGRKARVVKVGTEHHCTSLFHKNFRLQVLRSAYYGDPAAIWSASRILRRPLLCSTDSVASPREDGGV